MKCPDCGCGGSVIDDASESYAWPCHKFLCYACGASFTISRHPGLLAEHRKNLLDRMLGRGVKK